ncbi:MAG: type II secretion system protein [Planctomycetota bacterium]|jgi:prepilin-type N-terminal cleavage/methylation domain-containing protein/prepilin-type processing-associated H-X9-DG protein
MSFLKKKDHKNKSRAFTLIELLVVISIIALLLSVIVPSLNRAKDAAKKVICRSNLKNISYAAFLWSDDNDGWMPPALWDRGTQNEDGQIQDPLLQEYLDTGAGDNVMHCPALKSRLAGKTYGQLGIPDAELAVMGLGPHNFINSYGYNAKLCGKTGGYSSNDDGSGWGRNNVWYNKHGNCKRLTIDTPYQKIMFPESWSYIAYPEIYRADPNPDSLIQSPADRGLRHSVKTRKVGSALNHDEEAGTMNIAWCDGSVSIAPKDFEEFDESKGIYKRNGKYWYGKTSW